MVLVATVSDQKRLVKSLGEGLQRVNRLVGARKSRLLAPQGLLIGLALDPTLFDLASGLFGLGTASQIDFTDAVAVSNGAVVVPLGARFRVP